MENNRPEYLYRGICIRYDELKDFVFSGIDMELPYDPYIDSQGKETVRDGNEYGIYMSDNPKVAEYAYGNATNKEDGTYIEPKVTIGNRGNEFIKIPAIGVCYKISTKGLDIRKPWVRSELQGVYNNGFKGDEWITSKIPAKNYEIMSVQIGKDILHDEQYIDLDDIKNIKENTIQILEHRKARLEVFAQEMSKIPEQQRRDFGLEHLEILKEIYGENGFYYMESIDEIDSSSNVGMIRYLMANVYKNNTESIDFSTLLYLQDIKEKAELMHKKDIKFDLKEYLSNGLEKDKRNKAEYIESQEKRNDEIDTSLYDMNIAYKEKMLKIIKQKEGNELVNSNENEITPKVQEYSEENAEITDDIVDYYELYGIGKDEEWKTIKEILGKELKKWMQRSSTTNEKAVLDDIFKHIDEISDALKLFKPENEDKRKQYDAKLEQQKKRQVINGNVKEKIINKNNKIDLIDIAASIKNNPTSLEHLGDIQRRMANQIIQRQNNLQINSVDFIDQGDTEK